MEHRILIVEDEEDIQDLIKETLEGFDYETISAKDGFEARKIFEEEADSVDLIILDIMIPKINGMTLLRRIRKSSAVPVLILSAKDGESDKILGLELGADDYLSKPFSVLELHARVSALLRRNNEYQGKKKEKDSVIRIRDFVLDVDKLTVKKEGELLELTAKEFQLFKLFIEQPDKIYTKVQLYEAVWDDQFLHDENIINVHIRRLRKKVEEDPSNPQMIKTVWGIGYTLGGSE